MWIQRLSVENWRGLTCDMANLHSGLNLISGPNESGKSRLVEALRFALFESSAGQANHKRDLGTWGVSPGKPRVIVHFELNGNDYQLEKVFLDRGCNTRLRGPGLESEGEEAETRLADMLGVSGGSGRSEVKLEDRGVWSLLWVDQGASRDQPTHSDASQSRILSQLTEEIGEVAAGEFGQEMLDRAEACRNQYYSASRAAERSTITEPRQTVEDLEDRLTAAAARRDELAQAADALEHARENVTDLTGRHSAAHLEYGEIETRHKTAEKLRQDLAIAQEKVRSAERDQNDARDKQATAENLATSAQTIATHIEEVTEQIRREATTQSEFQQTLDAANVAMVEYQTSAETMDATIRALRQRKVTQDQREQWRRLSAQLTGARELATRHTELRDQLAGLVRITPEDVIKLRQAIEAQTTARARLDGASVAVELTARSDLEVDGSPLLAGESVLILAHDNRRVEIRDTVSVDIKPGAGEIITLRDALRDAEHHLTELKQDLGVADLAEAEQISLSRGELNGKIERLTEQIGDRVPEGIEALDQQVRELQITLGAAEQDDTDATPFDPAELETAETRRQSLADSYSEARARRDAAAEGHSEVRANLAALRSRLESDQTQHQQLSNQLAALPDTDQRQAMLQTAERAYGERLAMRDELQRQFQATGGEGVGEDLNRARKARDQLRDTLQSTREESVRLEATLRSAGDDGRHEQVQELEAEFSMAQAALTRVLRDATTAQRLFDVLNLEYKAARERLTQPVIERIRPYLEDLFPGCEVWLDEDLELRGLRTSQANESFEFLSGGAREQLSLLVRIGLAEVLGTRESWPLVLDDVLVNTDAERIRRMQRALYHAGQKMQIVLFTCHGPLFDTLGPDAYIELPQPPPRSLQAAVTDRQIDAGSDSETAR